MLLGSANRRRENFCGREGRGNFARSPRSFSPDWLTSSFSSSLHPSTESAARHVKMGEVLKRNARAKGVWIFLGIHWSIPVSRRVLEVLAFEYLVHKTCLCCPSGVSHFFRLDIWSCPFPLLLFSVHFCRAPLLPAFLQRQTLCIQCAHPLHAFWTKDSSPCTTWGDHMQTCIKRLRLSCVITFCCLSLLLCLIPGCHPRHWEKKLPMGIPRMMNNTYPTAIVNLNRKKIFPIIQASLEFNPRASDSFQSQHLGGWSQLCLRHFEIWPCSFPSLLLAILPPSRVHRSFTTCRERARLTLFSLFGKVLRVYDIWTNTFIGYLCVLINVRTLFRCISYNQTAQGASEKATPVNYLWQSRQPLLALQCKWCGDPVNEIKQNISRQARQLMWI